MSRLRPFWTLVLLVCPRGGPYDDPVQLSPSYLAMSAYNRGRLVKARLAQDVSWTGVRILGYHRIADVRDDLAVRPVAFREQMERVLEAGVEPIPLDRVADMLAEPVHDRFLCVTFDDGYLDNVEEAVPVLTELGIPATIFVPTQVIEGRTHYHWYEEPPPAMSWEDIDQLVRGGLVDVQSHTRTHPRLPHVSDDQAWDEIVGSKRDLELRVPYGVTSLCYPAGLHGAREERLVAAAGYRMGLSTAPGINQCGQDLFRLNRTLLYMNDRIGDFAAKLTGRLDHQPLLRAAMYRRLARG